MSNIMNKIDIQNDRLILQLRAALYDTYYGSGLDLEEVRDRLHDFIDVLHDSSGKQDITLEDLRLFNQAISTVLNNHN